MSPPIRAITVYCASSAEVDSVYFAAAERLGEALARAGYTLVYGGGALGLMGTVADSVHRHGGRVHGIITEKLVSLEVARHTCDELEIVETMRQRKQRLEDLADGFITLPGGPAQPAAHLQLTTVACPGLMRWDTRLELTCLSRVREFPSGSDRSPLIRIVHEGVCAVTYSNE